MARKGETYGIVWHTPQTAALARRDVGGARLDRRLVPGGQGGGLEVRGVADQVAAGVAVGAGDAGGGELLVLDVGLLGGSGSGEDEGDGGGLHFCEENIRDLGMYVVEVGFKEKICDGLNRYGETRDLGNIYTRANDVRVLRIGQGAEVA